MTVERRGSRLSRRQLMVGAGSAALLAGCGRPPWQPQAPRVQRVGWLGGGWSSAWYEAFQQGMHERGYIEGQDLVIEARRAADDLGSAEMRALVTELVGLAPDVIVSSTPLWTAAAQQATTTIPIVFGISSDPIAEGFVASLSRPGGNLTGVSDLNSPLNSKRVELLAQAVPGLMRLAVLHRQETSLKRYVDETEAAARTLGIEPILLGVGSPQDFDRLFEVAAREQAKAVAMLPGTLGYANRISELATAYRLPTICPQREFVEAGGLMSYGPNFLDNFRRAAYYVDRILKGAKPADLPVEQPMRFELIVNMNTARELGITFSHEVALQITEVIE
jgi:putative ABC transport system substrate-binding protein